MGRTRGKIVEVQAPQVVQQPVVAPIAPIARATVADRRPLRKEPEWVACNPPPVEEGTLAHLACTLPPAQGGDAPELGQWAPRFPMCSATGALDTAIRQTLASLPDVDGDGKTLPSNWRILGYLVLRLCAFVFNAEKGRKTMSSDGERYVQWLGYGERSSAPSLAACGIPGNLSDIAGLLGFTVYKKGSPDSQLKQVLSHLRDSGYLQSGGYFTWRVAGLASAPAEGKGGGKKTGTPKSAESKCFG